MGMEQMLPIISSVGFPIFVAVWLLWKSEKTEKRTQELLMELKNAIDSMVRR